MKHRPGLARMSQLMKPTCSCPRKGLKSSWLGVLWEGVRMEQPGRVGEHQDRCRKEGGRHRVLGMSRDARDAGNTGHLPHLGQLILDLQIYIQIYILGSACQAVPPGLSLLSLWPCSSFAAHSQEAVSAQQ